MEKKFALVLRNKTLLNIPDELEIDLYTVDGLKDRVFEEKYIVSNSKLVEAEIYAPEINLYLDNTQDKDPDTIVHNLYRLFQARNLLHLYSTDLPIIEKIGNKVVLVGNEVLKDKVKDIDKDDVLDILAVIEKEQIESIGGKIGELTIKLKDNRTIVSDQILFQNRPDEFEIIGVWDVDEAHIQDVISETIDNVIYGYEYVKVLKYSPDICQRKGRITDICGYCADTCPVNAITKVDEGNELKFIDINCTRCGGCVSVCPSGALDYRVPDRSVVHMMSKLFKQRIPLIIPEPMLTEGLNIKLKENVLPFVIGGKKFLDESHLLTILQESGSQVVLYNDNVSKGTNEAIELLNGIYLKKYGKQAVFIATTLQELEDSLKKANFIDGSYNSLEIDVYAKKREIFSERLSFIVGGDDLGEIHTKEHIHYGIIQIDDSKCTLCLSCANVCNVEALKPFEHDNTLRINPSICTACGYCIEICPENCMSIIEDTIYLNRSWFEYKVLARDNLFRCIVCGKPFAPSRSIEKIAKQMISLWGDSDVRVKTLFCCPECKPKLMMGDELTNRKADEKIKEIKGKIFNGEQNS